MRASLRKNVVLLSASVISLLLLLACTAVLGEFEVDPNAQGQADSAAGDGSDSGTGADGNNQTDTGATTTDAGDGGDGGPKTYCDDVVQPPGVVQFLCADFDSPLLNKNWDNVNRTDGGLLEKTTDVAFSAPNALLTGVSGGPAEGVLVWKRPGAKEFEQVTARVQINPDPLGGLSPPVDPLLELLDMRTSNSSVTFGFSRGSTAFPGGATYHGWFVANAAFGGAAAITRYKIATALPPNVWTEVKLVWGRDGKIDLTYNGISVLSVNGYSTSDTVVTVRLGAHVSGFVNVMPRTRFDNAEFGIRRVP